MDEQYLKEIGRWIIAVTTALFIAIGILIGEFQLKPYWIGFLGVFMAATEYLIIQVIRKYFKVPNEEETKLLAVNPLDWKYVTADTSDGGTVSFWIKTDGTVSWTDPNEES